MTWLLSVTPCLLPAHNQEAGRLATEIHELDESLEAGEKLLEQRINELESRNKDVSRLNDHTEELKEEINRQSESLRAQSESHADTCEELNAQICSISDKLETLQTTHNDIFVHAEKLENLNHALHESAISEKAIHKKVLEEKACEIDLLRTQLETENESLDNQPDNAVATERLQMTLLDLESRLEETEAQKQIIGERARAADELDAEVEQLRTALQEARNTGSQNTVDAQALQALNDQVTELKETLETSRAEHEIMAGKLCNHEALKQEVTSLREIALQAESKIPEQADISRTVDILREEAEKLRAALSTSEEKCKQLQAQLSSAHVPAVAGGNDTSSDTHDSSSLDRTTSRNEFVSHLNKILSTQDGSGMEHTVMFVFLDNFIRIRNEIGIINSVHVLAEVTGIITSSCCKDDIISQFGDCAFAILSCNESTDVTQKKAETIRSIVEEHIFESSDKSLVTTTSIGICSVRDNDTSAEAVVSRADRASEEARSSGGNQVLVNSAITDDMVAKGGHDEIIRKTLSENRIRIYYQPISSLKSNTVDHYEVLIRIVDDAENIILPGEFFSIAENSGHATDIDLYVIENIMRMMSENVDQPMKLFIKLTRQSVADQDLPIWLVGKIKEYSIDPVQLVFEVAESVMENDLKNLSMLSSALNSIGCEIAIEHYRMSTQPQYLQHIHADYLKIDSSLIGNIGGQEDSLPKISKIMSLAREHDYITIAEGVEDPACMANLWEVGVDFVQGYFIQEPAGTRDYDFNCDDAGNEANEGNKASFTIW